MGDPTWSPDSGGGRRAAGSDRSVVDQALAGEEMGDLLFSIAQLSRRLGSGQALRKADGKFTETLRKPNSRSPIQTSDEEHDPRRLEAGSSAENAATKTRKKTRRTRRAGQKITGRLAIQHSR
jgi:hypothetical protein